MSPSKKVGRSLCFLVRAVLCSRFRPTSRQSSDRLPAIPHDVLLDPEGPALAAVVIAGLLECGTSADDVADRLIGDLIAHMRGRNGGTPSQSDLRLSSVLGEYRRSGVVRGSARQALIQNIRQIAVARLALDLSGDPVEDWLEVRRLLLTAEHEKLRIVGDDARFLRLLNRGTLLQDSLAAQWRTNGDYRGARNIVDAALRQEHFSASNRSWAGVNLMTLHKSKGK